MSNRHAYERGMLYCRLEGEFKESYRKGKGGRKLCPDCHMGLRLRPLLKKSYGDSRPRKVHI